MAGRKIYAVYDNGVLLGQYTSREAAARIGIPGTYVSAYAETGSKYLGRYAIEAIGDYESKSEKWAAEWDEVRQALLTQLAETDLMGTGYVRHDRRGTIGQDYTGPVLRHEGRD